jgi:hypothetical protein
MKRVYHHYLTWEDYKNGMFELSTDMEFQVNKSIELLSDNELFLNKGLEMVSKWTISAEDNLTNINCNRRAWVGQATCCYVYGSTETDTREAWLRLSEEQRISANKIADIIINQYEINYEKSNTKIHF